MISSIGIDMLTERRLQLGDGLGKIDTQDRRRVAMKLDLKAALLKRFKHMARLDPGWGKVHSNTLRSDPSGGAESLREGHGRARRLLIR